MSDDPIEIKGERLYSLAVDVANGDCGEYVYSLQEGKFYEYTKGYWKEIHSEKLMFQLQERLIKEVRVKSGEQWILQKGKVLTKYPPSRKKQILEHLKVIKHRELHDFNWSTLINFENYMFDVEGNNVLNHDKKYYSTIRVPYKYDSLAICELWTKTLDEIFEGDKDRSLALQEFSGYCLSTMNEHKKGLLLLGDTNTGKSTIIDIIRELIGDQNCSNVPLAYLSNPQYTPLLVNKLLNIDPEVNKEAVNYEREFKIITGGKNERVSCNQKHVPTFEFTPRCKIILSANEFPRITDHSSAFYQRLMLIPCNREFKEEEMDKELPDKLRKELPGIFNWAIEGYYRLRSRGRFDKYNFMSNAVNDLEDENNPAHLFFKDHIEGDLSEGLYIEKSELFDKYKIWSKNNEQKTISHILFSKCLLKKFGKYTTKDARLTGNGSRIWRNIKYINNNILQTSKQEIDYSPS